jgi:hypothetical protein
MNNRFNQRQYALNRIAERGNIFPYSREYANSLVSDNQPSSVSNDVYPAQFTKPLPEYGYGQYNMGNPKDVDMSALNTVTAPQSPPQSPPQSHKEEEEFDGGKAYLDWYANKVNSEPMRFASIRDKLQKGW